MATWICGLGLPVFVATAVVMLSQSSAGRFAFFPGDGFSFNTDQLYPYSVLHRLYHGQYEVAGYLSAVSYFFPDMILLLPGMVLTSDFVVCFLIYNLLFFAMLTLILFWTYQEVGMSRPWIIANASVLLLLGALLKPTGTPSSELSWRLNHVPQDMLSRPGGHGGAVLVSLCLFALSLRITRLGVDKLTATMLVLLAGLGTWGDRLLIPQGLAPLGGAFILFWLSGRVTWTCMRSVVLLLLAGWGFSLLLEQVARMQFVSLAGGGRLAGPDTWFGLKPLLRDAGVFLDQPMYLVGVAYTVVAALCALQSLRRRHNEAGEDQRWRIRAVLMVSTLSLLINFSAVTGLGCWEEVWSQRYLLPLFMYPCLYFAMVLAALKWTNPMWTTWLVTVLAVGLAVPRVIEEAVRFEARHLQQPYPELVQEIDRLAEERGYRFGLAGFWEARTLTYLSRKVNVKCLHWNSQGIPGLHIESPFAFLGPKNDLSLPRYSFVVACREPASPHPHDIVRLFGVPREKRPVGNYEIWDYGTMINESFDAFLRGMLAERLQHACTPIAPAPPTKLARRRQNDVPADDNNSIALPSDRCLTVPFADTLAAGVVDLSACATDALEVTFAVGDRELAAEPVPAVAWHSPDVLFSRLIAVPSKVQDQSWDRLVIRSRQGKLARIGHVLLYRTTDCPALVELPTSPREGDSGARCAKPANVSKQLVP